MFRVSVVFLPCRVARSCVSAAILSSPLQSLRGNEGMVHTHNFCLIPEEAPSPARSWPIIVPTVCTPTLAAADTKPIPTSK